MNKQSLTGFLPALLSSIKEALPPAATRRLGVLSLLGLLALQAICSMRLKSATFDEVAHLPAGYSYVKTGDFHLNPEQPPLIKLLAAIPLLFIKVNSPEIRSWQNGAEYELGHNFLYRANDGDRLLFWGRMPVVLLALLMGHFVYRWARLLYGTAAGFLALFLCCFSPDVVAHSQLVTMDLGAACFSFITFYFLYQLILDPSLKNATLSGVFLGLALVAKFTTLLIFPAILASLWVIFRHKKFRVRWTEKLTNHGFKGMKAWIVLLLFIGLVAYGMILGAYLFRYDATTTGEGHFLVAWDSLMPRAEPAKSLISLLRDKQLLPEAFIYGLLFITRSPAATNRHFYLSGEVSTTGWWHYFFVTFLLKTPIPLLILIATAVLWLAKAPIGRTQAGGQNPELFLLMPVFVYFGLTSFFKLNIGHRHLLPLYPFLFVFVSRLAAGIRKDRPIRAWGFAVLLFWYLLAGARIYPHYLAYFNELAGGPAGGYRYLVDSNLDWGQDLKGLKVYLDQHSISKIKLSYFGSASPDYYKLEHELLPSVVSYPLQKRVTQVQEGDLVAVSATNLELVYFKGKPGFDEFVNWMERLRTQYRPVAQIGFSIFVYKVTADYLLPTSKPR